MSKYLKRAMNHFYNKEFQEALLDFSLELEKKPNSKDAKVGAMLSDLAQGKEEEAIALFEYYLVAKQSDIKDFEESIKDIIDALEIDDVEQMSELLFQKELETKIDEENGIAYDDFKTIIDNKKSFKEAFEDIMFSTKVIIHNKEDFLDFLEQLLENGFTEMSMSYFESAVSLFPNDEKLLALIQKSQE
jgi:tetratricopeptide (TPR) repeat protein